MVKSRISVGNVQVFTILLPEVSGKCPLCGKFPLSETKNGRVLKQYEIAHIYPHSPTNEQEKILKDVPKVKDLESLDNVILLCKDCHKKQDFHTTVKDYMMLFNVKRRLQGNSDSKNKLGNRDIDYSILKIIDSLKTMNISDLDQVDLRLIPLKIDQKIKNNLLLADDIKEKVVKYYYFIQEQFQILEGSTSNNFRIVASQIRTAYLKASSSSVSQEEVFNQLAQWLDNLNPEVTNSIASKIVISFFVQDCEVFDEVSE